MEDCLRESMRKLAVWYTKTFKPIMTHEELEPIMATLGFVGLPPAVNGAGVAWKEYKYSAGGHRCKSVTALAAEAPPIPRPRLPYPRIDGLHIYTYRAFIDAVNFYLEKFDISDLFHIRGMPLYRNHDRNRKWRRMDEEGSVFVYREGTLDQTTLNSYNFHRNNINGTKRNDLDEDDAVRNLTKDNNNLNEKEKPSTPAATAAAAAAYCIVSLKDIIQ